MLSKNEKRSRTMKGKTIGAKALGIITAALFAAFAVFTVLVLTVDVQRIGPMGSEVGFANNLERRNSNHN